MQNKSLLFSFLFFRMMIRRKEKAKIEVKNVYHRSHENHRYSNYTLLYIYIRIIINIKLIM